MRQTENQSRTPGKAANGAATITPARLAKFAADIAGGKRLDPPGIARRIMQFFKSRPDQGERLWAIVSDGGILLQAWKAYARKHAQNDFWTNILFYGYSLDKDQEAALRKMVENPLALMHLCRVSSVLSLACRLFADQDPDTPGEQFAEQVLTAVTSISGEIMVSGYDASGFWPPDTWWMPHVWDAVIVRLASIRDPVEVARWVAAANPVLAGQCLPGDRLAQKLDSVDVCTLNIGEIAWRKLQEFMKSHSTGHKDHGPVTSLTSLVLHAVTPKRRRLLARLLVPRAFQAEVSQWVDFIDEPNLDRFVDGLASLWNTLNTGGTPLASLRAGRRKKRLVIYIDDEIGLLRLIRIMITRGYGGEVEVVTVPGGPLALVAASVLQPDFVVTGVMMPTMDGIECMRYLRANPATKDIRFMFLSARDGTEAVCQGMEVGAERYLSKPILHQDLIQALTEELEKGSHT